MTRALRLGIINLMPQAESYEQMLLAALSAAQRLPEAGARELAPIWLRLRSHAYSSSDQTRLAAYRTFDEIDASTLDGLILTGAPVEELPYAEVHYWDELRELLTRAEKLVPSTLGLCWGGMALAKLLGIEKVNFPRKLFGLYPMQALGEAENWSGSGTLFCAHSRHAGIDDAELERAERAGDVQLLAHSTRTGYTLFASSDQRFVMHLGHPEYPTARLLYEYQRDQRTGRADVDAPEGIDLASGEPAASSHGPDFFARWLARLATFRR